MQSRKLAKLAIACALGAVLSACALTPVQPYEKGNLAKPIMALEPDPLESRFAQGDDA
jgi:hypothetical protein